MARTGGSAARYGCSTSTRPRRWRGPGRRWLPTRTRLRRSRGTWARTSGIDLSMFWTSTRRRSGPWLSWFAIRPGARSPRPYFHFFLLLHPPTLRSSRGRRSEASTGVHRLLRCARGAAVTWWVRDRSYAVDAAFRKCSHRHVWHCSSPERAAERARRGAARAWARGRPALGGGGPGGAGRARGARSSCRRGGERRGGPPAGTALRRPRQGSERLPLA